MSHAIRPGRSGSPGSLREAGYAVDLDRWDLSAGDNFVVRMSEALDRAEIVVAVAANAYFEVERFTTPGVDEDRAFSSAQRRTLEARRRVLGNDSLATQRPVLGDDHPDTVRSVQYLAGIERRLEEKE
ncbi:toll/interleukin-1 receptor domain-containing protein [Asanoa sp. NPDC049573]|uniref:toll/interleukin-1 receptor domain-containing protein n=1 Tax=Asanoa sp. NPDC049573 TaxID=3155396 RepID=UPI00342443F9